MRFNSGFKGLNGLVRFADRRNLVSARMPSHFKRSLPTFRVSRRKDDKLGVECRKTWGNKKFGQILLGKHKADPGVDGRKTLTCIYRCGTVTKHSYSTSVFCNCSIPIYILSTQWG